MQLEKGFKYMAIAGILVALTLGTWQLLSPLKVVSLFPFSFFMLITAYSSYLLFLFLPYNTITQRPLFKYLWIVFFLLPVIIVGYQITVYKGFLENNWPFLLGLLVFISGLTLIKLLGFFDGNSQKPFIVNASILIIGLISLFFAGLIFGNILNTILFTILSGTILLMSLLAFFAVLKIK